MTGALVLALTMTSAQGPAAEPVAGLAPTCLASAQAAVPQSTAALCLAEAEERMAAAPALSALMRALMLERAAQQFRRAADATRLPEERVTAVEGLARVFDAVHLNRPGDEEAALRELIGAQPNELEPMFRLAQWLENRDLIDAAEDTLQSARRRQPENLEPYRRLAQFYARRAVAMQPGRPVTATDVPEAAKPDEKGVFPVGGPVAAPRREGVAQLPDEARLLGVEGAVRLEIVVDEKGVVTDARVVRSVPLLDAEAVRTVKEWRFAPTIVDGRAVPVKMEAVVNFSAR